VSKDGEVIREAGRVFSQPEPRRSNSNGVPIPPTPWQIAEAHRSVQHDFGKRPKKYADGIKTAIDYMLQGFRDRKCPVQATALRYCRLHLNGF
jgi:hypothetical protein